MIPEFPKFKPIGIDDRDEMMSFVARNGYRLCEYGFSNLFIWLCCDPVRLTKINGNLCILMEPRYEESYFLGPVGNNRMENTIRTCLDFAKKVSRVSAEHISSISADYFDISELSDHYDYLYRTRDLAELCGRKYDGKRNHVKRFFKANPMHEFVPLSMDDRAEALELFGEWNFNKWDKTTPKEFPMSACCEQRLAIMRAFEHYDEIGLVGNALRIDGRMIGFIMGAPITDDTVCIHFHYCRPSFSGASAALLSESCSTTFADFQHVNLEQDLGLPGLRKMKQSYHPVRLERKFEIEPL